MGWWWLAGVAWAGPAELALEELALEELVSPGVRGEVRAMVQPLGTPVSGGLGARGAVVRVVQDLDGLPVDVDGALWLAPDGSVRARRALPDLPVREGPVLTADEARATVARTVAGVPGPGRLSWQEVAGALSPVWTFPVHHAAHADLDHPIVRVHAVSGGVLSVEEGGESLDGLAWVYETSPADDAETLEVTLDLPGFGLFDERMELRQCRDLQEVVSFEVDGTWWDYHVCTEVPSDPAPRQDYRAEPVPYPEDPARDEDRFAPPNLFHHVQLGLDAFEAMGWAPLPDYDPYLEVVANLRVTDELTRQTAGDPALPLRPYDNAYHTGGYEDWEGNWVAPRLVFGQGREIDYAYDADVIYHELAHFIVSSREGPRGVTFGSTGPVVDAGAMNEGLADYFAAVFTGDDPEVGEYAAGTERDHIRTLQGDASCTADRYGQVHYDSQPFSQGLWAFRDSLSVADRPVLDQTVLDALTVIGRNGSFAEAFDVITAGVEDTLGAAAATALAEEWQGRGLDDCPPVVTVDPTSDDAARSFTQLPHFSVWSYDPYLPGYAQFVIDVTAGDVVTLTVSQTEFLGIDPYGTNTPQPPVVVGGPGERIEWDITQEERAGTFYGYDTYLDISVFTHDAAELGEMTPTGTRPHDDEPDRYRIHDYELQWVADTTGPMVFQFVNPYDGYSQTLLDIDVSVVSAEGSTTDPSMDTGTAPTDADPSGGGGSTSSTNEAAGCGCTTGPAGGAGWLLGLGAVLWRRRRRRAGQGQLGSAAMSASVRSTRGVPTSVATAESAA